MQPKQNSSETLNRDSYNHIADRWNESRHQFYGREQVYLDTLLAAIPPGGTVLDLGCGTGRPMAEYVVSQGHHVIGIDQSEAMLTIAQKRLPRQQWILSTLEAYQPPPGFHAALLWDSLFHIPRTKHESILRKVIHALPPGGRLMLTVGGSDHPAFTDEMYDHPFFYDSFTPGTYLELLHSLGCQPVLSEFMNLPDGARNKGRFAIVAEKT